MLGKYNMTEFPVEESIKLKNHESSDKLKRKFSNIRNFW